MEPISPHRIAFVVGTLTMGGSTTYLFNLAKGLLAKGHQCLVICDDNVHPMSGDFNEAGIRVICLGRRGTIYEDRMASVIEHLASFRPTVQVGVLGHFSFDSLHYAPEGVLRIAMALSDDPLVYSTLRPFSAAIDIVVGNAHEIIRRLGEITELGKANKVYVPSAIPIPTPCPRTWDAVTPLKILFLGRIHREQKRVHFFPPIMEELLDSGIHFHWTIAGDGPDLPELKARMERGVKSEHVSFTGQIPYSQIPVLFREHDLFLMTSDYEGLPMSLVEAMVNGMVPVVSDLKSGMREVVDESCGILVPPGNPVGYATAIKKLHADRMCLPVLSAAAISRIRAGYTQELMTSNFLTALQTPKSPPSWTNLRTPGPPFLLKDRTKFHPLFRQIRRVSAKLRIY